jgi:phage shock protein C
MANQNVKRLYRSKNNKIIAGVCGGLAEYFSIDPTIMRIIYVLLSIVTGIVPLIIIYLIMWVLIPLQP